MEIKLINVRSLIGKRLLKTIMKTFIFLLCSTAFCLNTGKTFSQEKIIIEKDQSATIYQVFKIIKQQTDFNFVYPRKVFKDVPRIELKKGEIAVSKLLEKSLSSNNLNFKFAENNTILIKEKPRAKEVEKQQHLVSGIISDENGQPLAGASVVIEGTKIGTTTDIDGKFSLNIDKETAVLVVSYVGYFSQKISVTSETKNVKIQLNIDVALLDQVVISGYRQMNKRAINMKKNSPVIGDFIAEDNLGQLPDFNVAEALSRVPGISVEQSRGEDRYVTVRGLKSALNYASLDGGIIPSTDNNSRAVPMDILPSSLVSGITINKSFNASMDGNAIGSNINLSTRSAFATNEPYLVIDGSFGKYDQDEGPVKTNPSMTFKATYANQLSENWGIVLSGSFYNRENYTNLPAVTSGLWDWYDDAGTRYTEPFDTSHNGYPVPTGQKAFLYLNDRERYGGFAKIEYRKDNFSAFASLLNYRFHDDERRYETLIDRQRNDVPTNQTPTSGTQARASMQTAVVDQLFDFKISGIQLEMKYNVDDHYFKLGFNDSKGKYNQPYTWDKFNSSKIAELGYDYTYDDPVNGFPIFDFTDPSYYADGSNFRHLYHREIGRQSREDVMEVRFDYKWRIPNSNWVFDAGVKFRNLDRIRDRYNNEWKLIDRDNFTLDQSIHDYNVVPENFQNFPMYLVDPDIANAFYRNNQELFNPHRDNEVRGFRDDFNVSEDVVATYSMLGYESEKIDFNLGLRYENTEFKSKGFQKLDEDGVITYPEISVNNKYDYLLPSFSVNYKPSKKIKIQGAYSQTLGRASYNDLRPNQNRTEDPGIISISGGNPNLLPRESTNYDLSLEYYFAGGDGLLSAAVFHKDIKNEIYTARTTEESTIGGVLTETKTTFPANAESADITGFEFGFVLTEMPFLPKPLQGLGLSLNYAYFNSNTQVLKSDGTTRDLYGFLNQPKNIFNAALTYSIGDFETKFAYNYRDERLVAINTSQDWKDRFHDARHTMDLQMRYRLSKHFNVKLNIKNLDQTAQVSEINEQLQYKLWERDYGRSAWIGITYRL